MNQIITRFPPSPTGDLHLGGARTALFNWLHARHSKGRFVLRIEDTDRVRSTQQSVDAIFAALNWLGINWDEGPHFQSQRFDIYRDYTQRLIDAGKAYYCTCSPERLEQVRSQAMATGGKPKYDGHCRDKQLTSGADQPAVVRFRAPLTGSTTVADVIKGHVTFDNSELDDFIIQRSDGTPTYNFCVVIDDFTMGINTIIRGDDHLNNTPKQILIYQALEAPLPTFGHVPMVMGTDRKRLSKRHGALSVLAYRDMGYLPEALINYLVRLGWSYGDQEFFTPRELIEKFTLDNIGKSAGIFDPEKLLALNAEHIKKAPASYIAQLLAPILAQQGVDVSGGPDLTAVVATLNTRSKTLLEMAEAARFYFASEMVYDEKAAAKFFKPAALEPLRLLRHQLAALEKFDQPGLEGAFKAVMEATGLKLGKIAQPTRLALTGTTVSPGIFEIIAVLDRERTIKRLDQAIACIENQA